MNTKNNSQNIEQPEKKKNQKKTRTQNQFKSLKNKPQKISIELNKYKSLTDALGKRKKVKRLVFTIFVLGILLFVGITIITLSIKRLYPYSDITTNGLGATTIKSEKNEVSYWLFNTATLWANSGIHVNKGDIITIRASGKSHTAIHHLYDAASKNYEITGDNKDAYHEWVGSEGIPKEKETGRGVYRRKYRIFPDMPSGALLMQVAQNEKHFDTPKDGDSENFYFIGQERQQIYINSEGTLHFAVNDIVLNRPTIAQMMWETICEKYNAGDTSLINKLVNKYQIANKVDYHQGLQTNTSKRNGKEKTEKEEGFYDTIKIIFDSVISKEVNEANRIDRLSNPYLCLRKNSFSDAVNDMCTIIYNECNNDKRLIDFIKKYCTLDTSFINGVCCQRDFCVEPTDSIIKLNNIKIIYDTLSKIKNNNLFPKIGKMELGYSRSSHQNKSLICELSYYYGDSITNNEKRKTVWFDDNIGSFLIIVEKTK